jgi:hypothetical protein
MAYRTRFSLNTLYKGFLGRGRFSEVDECIDMAVGTGINPKKELLTDKRPEQPLECRSGL